MYLERENFVFHKSFYEVIKELPDAEKLEVYDYMFKFVFLNDEPKISKESSLPLAIFKVFKQVIDLDACIDEIYK